MTIDCRGLKVEVKVKVIGQANTVGATSTEDSIFLVLIWELTSGGSSRGHVSSVIGGV